MENLMIKAIRQFKKEHKKAEIRSCSAWESSGVHGKTVSALFHIEYVEQEGGDYKGCEIYVSKDN